MTRLSVSRLRDLRCARALHSYEAQHGDVEGLRRVVKSLGLESPPSLMDSQAKHAVVAAGAADVLLRIPPDPGFRDAIWDQAAGALLIEEAGGRVTDLAGRTLDFSRGRRLSGNEGLVATNGALHEAVLAAVHQALPRRSHSDMRPGRLVLAPKLGDSPRMERE
jgi:3'(2'), 5'-bisphosphate nucleotidase